MALFKAYDIRGIVPDELDASKAYLIGRATAHFVGDGPIAVGRDARVHSPELTAALVDGIRDEGIDVIELGLVATPILYFGGRAQNCFVVPPPFSELKGFFLSSDFDSMLELILFHKPDAITGIARGQFPGQLKGVIVNNQV